MNVCSNIIVDPRLMVGMGGSTVSGQVVFEDEIIRSGYVNKLVKALNIDSYYTFLSKPRNIDSTLISVVNLLPLKSLCSLIMI